MSLVSLVRIRKNTTIAMKNAIIESLDHIGYSFEDNIETVVIKPNLCYYWDASTGQTTDPRFIAALIDVIREKTSSKTISIVESDASAMRCKQAFRFLGYEKLASDYGVELINLSEESYNTTSVKVGTESFSIMVPKIIQDADLKINVSKIKYAMEQIKLTCALKNIYGCNPFPKKFKYHSKLGETIVAMNKAMKFDLCLVDGNTVSGIQPRRIGLVMASKDPVAIDVAAAEIASINPKAVKYLRLASNEGLGSTSYIPKGVPLKQFKDFYPRKTLKKKLMSKAYSFAIQTGLDKKLGLH